MFQGRGENRKPKVSVLSVKFQGDRMYVRGCIRDVGFVGLGSGFIGFTWAQGYLHLLSKCRNERMDGNCLFGTTLGSKKVSGSGLA